MKIKQVLEAYINQALVRVFLAFMIFILITFSPVHPEALYHKVTYKNPNFYATLIKLLSRIRINIFS